MASVTGVVQALLHASQQWTQQSVVVALYPLEESEQLSPGFLHEVLNYRPWTHAQVLQLDGETLTSKFSFTDVASGKYAIFAFSTRNQGSEVSINDFEVGSFCGWYKTEAYGWFEPASVPAESTVTIEIRSARSKGFLKEQQTEFASFWELRAGLWVLKLSGSNYDRGYAHGKILASEILDFFEFFCLEMLLKARSRYENVFLPHHTKNIIKPDWYQREIEGVIAGMKDSGVSMYLPLLERDFDLGDLHFCNTFAEVRSASDIKANAEVSCTQFSFWGGLTKGSDVDGGIIAGRNMDGEIDIRKVTVTHFLAIAHEPVNESEKRFISFMWPGWVLTYTGVNEDGVYCCINAGNVGPGQVVGNIRPVGYIQRSILSQQSPLSVGGVADTMENNKCDGGGALGAGAVMVFASPKLEGSERNFGAFMYESDRYGGAIRLPGQRRPLSKETIMAANHFLVYGAEKSEHSDYSNPIVFGFRATHSTSWRYKVGMETIESWNRAKKPLGTPEMVRLLQSASQSTEHSIIMRVKGNSSQDVEIDVANGNILPSMLWDAPHQQWQTFSFPEAFVH